MPWSGVARDGVCRRDGGFAARSGRTAAQGAGQGTADDPDKTVLIIDANPTSGPPLISSPTTGPEFHPDAVYRINVDAKG